MKSVEIQKICEVLYTARTDQETRLTYAMHKRADMLSSLEKNDILNDYRYLWFTKHMEKILSHLDNARADLEENHPFDACSIQDYLNLLQASFNRVKAVGESFKKSPTPPQDL